MTWNWGMLPYVVVLLLLVWRVWRLEDSLRLVRSTSDTRLKNIEAEMDKVHLPVASPEWSNLLGHMIFPKASVASCTDVGGVRHELRELARALGYEWKSTPAKSGWERKPRVPMDHDIVPFYNFNRKVVGEYLWNNGDDRRKADRRKPVGIAVKQWCASCDEQNAKRAMQKLNDEINRPAKKKPRRAH